MILEYTPQNYYTIIHSILYCLYANDDNILNASGCSQKLFAPNGLEARTRIYWSRHCFWKWNLSSLPELHTQPSFLWFSFIYFSVLWKWIFQAVRVVYERERADLVVLNLVKYINYTYKGFCQSDEFSSTLWLYVLRDKFLVSSSFTSSLFACRRIFFVQSNILFPHYCLVLSVGMFMDIHLYFVYLV